MSDNVRPFVRNDAARLHCHVGKSRRIRNRHQWAARYAHPLPPKPEPAPSKRGHLVAMAICALVVLACMWLLLGDLYNSVGVR